MAITQTELDGILPLIARGKVRDIYEVNSEVLLFVATDRISAYDVIMTNPIPDKGILLTKLSEFWFNFLQNDIKNHLLPIDNNKTMWDYLPKELSENEKYKTQLEGRSLLVRKFKLIPLEVIVRGYITGSAWKEYQTNGTVHSIKQDDNNMKESQEFKIPIFTPSTKAEQGEHDENISIEQASKLIGEKLCQRVGKQAIELYTKCRDYARTHGIIIADTKFEFGIDETTDEIVLVDEVLTPDSSRFWNGSLYAIGKPQDSYDKQFLRDWLTANKLNGVDGVTMPEDIVVRTRAKYIEAYEALTGDHWSQ
ncbi:similar to Saccharomyces cerevisiae YAR015W ADE1 N-succinyl-5-aminoimidazole-4-carboxamide ribotide (SAICAR) synthetase, required for 'de novo' purine nucleotide biosynthesis [Maudiozyma saulgeensis]|uniref:Phosphoribosylaminoimidazole-succinocarboxamide synthase n=1 Tax=Maudiozyma saulgeensis TaxID=1789683 RepID=A0A1X7R3I1_9SACH|nr:similar to Saccharomyces cerevisiae YAR015W ADE1 N-succinyl-5-aminoimidazole-4-carboxamide ribotide (SAICAR) synthetase, required for 'de novo' purine nucleotide biosynthesis [Kazachstania saulgeensis]